MIKGTSHMPERLRQLASRGSARPQRLFRGCLATTQSQSAPSRALAISPNLAVAHTTLGATLIFSGRPKEGLAALDQISKQMLLHLLDDPQSQQKDSL